MELYQPTLNMLYIVLGVIVVCAGVVGALVLFAGMFRGVIR